VFLHETNQEIRRTLVAALAGNEFDILAKASDERLMIGQ